MLEPQPFDHPAFPSRLARVRRRQVPPVRVGNKIARTLPGDPLPIHHAILQKAANPMLVTAADLPGQTRVIQGLTPVGKNHLGHTHSTRFALGLLHSGQDIHAYVFAPPSQICKDKLASLPSPPPLDAPPPIPPNSTNLSQLCGCSSDLPL